MKTILACLGIVAAALFLGKVQGSRIEKLERRIPASTEPHRSKFHIRQSTDEFPAYRSKYQRTTHNAVAGDVFRIVIEQLEGRKSITIDSMASMTDRNKEALKVILQLDVSGIRELMLLISESNDQVLNSIHATKYEQISLCIIALADQDPGYALDFMTNIEHEEIDSKIYRDEETVRWLEYVLKRLSTHDPQRALNGLLDVAQDPENPWEDSRVLKVLSKIVRWEPGLVLDTIDRLPESKSRYFLRSLTYQMESEEEYTAFFHALRSRYSLQPERMEAGFASLFGRFGIDQETPSEVRKWAESLEMSDFEKSLLFNPLHSIDIPPAEGEQFARWFTEFLPESVGRDRLVFNAIVSWRQTDAPKADAFLAEQGIDPEEMMMRMEQFGSSHE